MKNTTLIIAVSLITMNTILGQEMERQNNRHDGPPPVEKIMRDLDTNNDGKIALSEVKGPLKNDFENIDVNEDGFLSKKELKQAPRPKRNKKFKN